MSNEGSPETIVGASLKVEGVLKSEGDLRIDGEVKGTISTKGTVSVGENARIEADINAAAAIVSGNVKGNLNITGKTSLKKTASVKGNISTQQIEIEAGAHLVGKCNTESAQKNNSPHADDQQTKGRANQEIPPIKIAGQLNHKESVSV